MAEGSTKKRKRHAEDSSQPNKKVNHEGKSVDISLHEGDQWAPVIASASGLVLPPSINLKTYTKPRKNAPQRPGRGGAIATTELLLHSSEHTKLDYTAREEGTDGADTLLKHYIGVYDPETNELEVMEARNMTIRGSVRQREATPEKEIFTDARSLRNELGQAFGTKKAKKAIASATENAISRPSGPKGSMPLDAASEAMLDSMAEVTKGMSTREELAELADAAKPRPKANLSTGEIKDVYTIDSLIGQEIQKLIPMADWMTALKEKKEIIFKSRYVARRIQKVGAEKPGVANSEHLKVEKLKLLRYLLALLEFHGTLRRSRDGMLLPKRDVLRNLGGMPDPVVESIKRKFSSGSLMSRFQVDFMITHVCALACLIDNYEVDLLDLREDLNLELKGMSQYFQEIGAKIEACGVQRMKELKLDKAAAAQRKFARLKWPLSFPKLATGRR